MICYINRSTVDYDVRLNKYVRICKENDVPYFVIAWDRMLNSKQVDAHEHQMKLYCPYAQGKKLVPSLRWLFFMWYYLIKNFRKYKVIHACNMENALFSIFFKMLGKKIVFDIYDSQIIKAERCLASKVDCLILPAEKRLQQIGVDKVKLKHFLEIENVPTFDVKLTPVMGLQRDKIYLSYVGIFQKKIRGIENVIKMVLDDERFVLDIAGTGDELDEMVKDVAMKCDRIHYYGKVRYSKALEIMNCSDFIVALYYPYSTNHVYASPNKLYEALFLSTPIITSQGTLVGDKVRQMDVGYEVDDTIDGLRRLFINIESEKFRSTYTTKCSNCTTQWKKKYSKYKETVLKDKYITLMKEFSG